MSDDKEFLREVFRPFDPARPQSRTREERADVIDFRRTPRSKLRRRGTGVAAAAAVAVLAAGGVWATNAYYHPGPNPKVGTSVSVPASAIPGFDHVRWQDWSDGRLVDTVDRWISSDGHGRLVEKNSTGRVTRDVTIAPPTASSTGTTKTTSPASAAASATAVPTSGADVEPVEYPGAVPTGTTLRAYLAAGGNDKGHISQRLVGLLFARALTTQQQRDVIDLAKTVAQGPVTSATAPDGERVTVIPLTPLVMSSQWWLAVSTDETRIVGITDQQTKPAWRLLLGSEHTTVAG